MVALGDETFCLPIFGCNATSMNRKDQIDSKLFIKEVKKFGNFIGAYRFGSVSP